METISSKDLLLDIFKTASSLGPAFQTVLTRTSCSPTLAQHTETGQPTLQLAFLKLTIFLIFLGPPQKEFLVPNQQGAVIRRPLSRSLKLGWMLLVLL